MSGKTTFANGFPEPLILNTDGNIQYVDAPYIAIRDQVSMEGRIKKVKFAWEVFKEAVDEKGLLGALTGGMTAAAGGTAAAICFGFLASLVFKSKTK